MKLVYNPFSGRGGFGDFLDEIIEIWQNEGYETHVFRINESVDLYSHLKSMGKYDVLAVAGGDGTLNIALNGLLDGGHDDVPILLIPSGTANDFASHLKLPAEPVAAARVLTENELLTCDVGNVNGKYFINVCAAGLLSNISQTMDEDVKHVFGKFAYYFSGLGQLSKFAPLPMRITNSAEVIETELYFFIILNSSGTGGFKLLSPNASISDGLFDFIGVRAAPLVDLSALLIKVLRHDIVNDSNVVFFRDSKIVVEPLFEDSAFYETDVDGESGPKLPITVENCHKAIKIFVPGQSA